jgi:replicative superfamily II helicase
MRGFLVKNVSTRFGDLETKLERICVITGKAEKLDVLLRKRTNVNDILFVR